MVGPTVSLSAPADPPAASDPVAGTMDLANIAASGGDAVGTSELFLGALPTGRAVAAVAFAGDFDGGGAQDLAFGMPSAGQVGYVAIVFGPARTNGDPDGTDLGELGDRGITLRGSTTDARVGSALAGAGDVNGDGLGDLLVGAPGERGAAGTAYLVFGGPRPSGNAPRLADLGDRVVRILGVAAGDETGASLATIGDLDGDGRPEIVVGAPGADGPGGRTDAGAVYVLYSSRLGGVVDLAQLGDHGYRIDGAAAGDRAGTSVASVRDMSRDGLSEVLVGAPEASAQSGAAYAVFGVRPDTRPTVDLATPGYGFAMAGTAGEHAGTAVAGIDTGTGPPRIAIGAPAATATTAAGTVRTEAGAVYVVRGRPDTDALTLPADGTAFFGGDPGEGLGIALAAAGAVDGPGSSGLLAGLTTDTALGRKGAGSALLLLLDRVTGPRVDTGQLGATGIRLAGPVDGARTGRALAGGVYVNGDDRPDALLGHRQATGDRGGASLVLLPRPPLAPVAPRRPPRGANVEVVVDDSSRVPDPGGVLRRSVLELLLNSPDTGVVGAVEFGLAAHEIVPPLRRPLGVPLVDARLALLRGLLTERIRSNAGAPANLAAGLAAAEASNPKATARILVVGEKVGHVPATLDKRVTFVLALGSRTPQIERLAKLAKATDGGDLYQLTDAGSLAAALTAISARLRGDEILETKLVEGDPAPPVLLGDDRVAAAADFPAAQQTASFTAELPRARAHARLVLSWEGTDDFEVTEIRLPRQGRDAIVISGAKVRRALSQQKLVTARGGIGIRATATDRTLSIELRGLRVLTDSPGKAFAAKGGIVDPDKAHVSTKKKKKAGGTHPRKKKKGKKKRTSAGVRPGARELRATRPATRPTLRLQASSEAQPRRRRVAR
jgi:FG-GAP repeat protein